jgi:hypothetical protein
MCGDEFFNLIYVLESIIDASNLLLTFLSLIKLCHDFGSFLFSQPDDLLSSKIQSLCPTITGNVCCTEAQFDTLRQQVQQA